MRHFYRILVLIFLLYLLCCISAATYVTETVDEELENRVRRNNDLQLLTSEPDKDVICCFDVDVRGWIALGFQHGDNKTICIYNERMEFQYGYVFSYNSDFGVFWDNGRIVIHYVRSDLGEVYDENGTLLEVYRIPNNAENAAHWDLVLHDSKRVVNACTYECCDDSFFQGLFNNGYSRLYVTDARGNRSLLYDAAKEGTNSAWRTVAWINGGLLFAGINTWAIITKAKQNRAGETTKES